MKILNLTAVMLLLVFTSCCTSNKTTAESAATDTMETKKMMEEGYIAGTIVASTAENDCAYVIKSEVDGNSIMFDPINLEKDYMKDGMKVWYKYGMLRMMNRCEKANPVNITAMKGM